MASPINFDPTSLAKYGRLTMVARTVVELCIERLDAGALLMADNALRQGEVVKPKNQQARNVAFYNELYFGPNAGWQSQVWEVTPAGYRHFDKRCTGNCFNAHPAYYYTYSYCSNRDGSTHFVYDCMDKW